MATTPLGPGTHALTLVDAAAAIRNAPRGTAFAAHVNIDLATENKPNKLYRGSRTVYVNLSRKEAERMANSLLTPLQEADGARIRFTVDSGIRNLYWLG